MGPGRCRHHPGGGGSRSTGRDGGTGEASSSGRRRHAVLRDGGWDRGGVVILRAAEARGPPGEGAGPGRRHPPGGRGSRSTKREGGTGEVSSSSWRRRLAVNREEGWDRGGDILREAEARGPPGGRVRPGRCRHPPSGGGSRSSGKEDGTEEVSLCSGRQRIAVHREGGRDRGGVVILRAAEARGPPGERVGPWSCHPPGGGGSRSTGREGGTGEVSSSGRRRLAVHREGGRDRGGVMLLAAEARGPLGGRGGSRSTGREGGTGEASSSSGRRRLAVHRRGGGTGEASSSGRRRLAVHREGGRNRGGFVILRAAEARGQPGGRAGPVR